MMHNDPHKGVNPNFISPDKLSFHLSRNFGSVITVTGQVVRPRTKALSLQNRKCAIFVDNRPCSKVGSDNTQMFYSRVRCLDPLSKPA